MVVRRWYHERCECLVVVVVVILLLWQMTPHLLPSAILEASLKNMPSGGTGVTTKLPS
jgi:hypothetical protein